MGETPTSTLAVYTARPTVRIDAQEYPKVSELMLGLEMTEHEGGMSALEMRVSNVASDPFGDAGLAFEDDEVLCLGARITVYTGDELEPREIFAGTITGLEAHFPTDGPPELTVLAEDALQRARMKRRTKVHEDMSLNDIARNLANDLGLTPVITGLDDTTGTYVQLNESDLAFLRRLLARHDGDVQVVGEELHVSPRAEVRRGDPDLELHGQLRRARVCADLSHQVTKVTVSGWNAIQGRAVTGASTGEDSGPGSGRGGSDVLRDALGERSHHISHLAVNDDDEASAIASAAFDARARAFVVVEGTAEGNAEIRVGTHVRLSGLGVRFDNSYYVVQTRHRFDARGYETDFTAQCGFLGAGR